MGAMGCCGSASHVGCAKTLWREGRKEAVRSGGEVERGGGGRGGVVRWDMRGTEPSGGMRAAAHRCLVASCVVVVYGRQTGSREHLGVLGPAMDIVHVSYKICHLTVYSYTLNGKQGGGWRACYKRAELNLQGNIQYFVVI